jgi:four helix bundle protein
MKVPSWWQKAERRRQKAKGRRQKAEGRRQKAEGKRQKAEGRRQKAETATRLAAWQRRNSHAYPAHLPFQARFSAAAGGIGYAIRICMEKPFDIRERTFLFACDAVRAFPERDLEPRTLRIWLQFVSAATSGGAHLEEAEAASSRAHFVTLNRGALRELREARYWLRIIKATKLSGHEKTGCLIDEGSELVAIVTTIVKTASAKLKRKSKRPGS